MPIGSVGHQRKLLLVLVVIMVGGLLALGMGWIREQQQLARESQCRGRLGQIVLALQNYHAENEKYPPLYTQDKEGKKLHSWRVLLLPYLLDDRDVLSHCNLSEPWNSPQNVRWSESLPPYVREYYKSPAQADYANMATSFVAIDPSDGHGGQRLALADDGCGANYITLVETVNSRIHWMEPRDMLLKEAQTGLLKNSRSVRLVTRRGFVATLSSSQLTFYGSEVDLLNQWLISPGWTPP